MSGVKNRGKKQTKSAGPRAERAAGVCVGEPVRRINKLKLQKRKEGFTPQFFSGVYLTLLMKSTYSLVLKYNHLTWLT